MKRISRDLPDGILPWTQSCFVCGEANPHGLRLRSRLVGGLVELVHTTRPADLGYRHLVHGGISATLLDEVMTWVAMLELGQLCVAAEFTVRLRGEVAVDTRLTARAGLVDAGRRLVLTAAELRDPAGAALATATGKYLPMPTDRRAGCHHDFVPAGDALSPALLFQPATGEVPA